MTTQDRARPFAFLTVQKPSIQGFHILKSQFEHDI